MTKGTCAERTRLLEFASLSLESRPHVSDLKNDLSALRIDRGRTEAGSSPSRWAIYLMVPAVLFLAGLYVLRVLRPMPEVSVVKVSKKEIAAGATAPGAPAGTPILTASGYVVARRKAVVSAQIQGRLASLRVEEGSRVREGEVFANLESGDYVAQVQRAEAAVQRAEADLAEYRRQARVAAGLARDQVLAKDSLEAADSRVAIAEAALLQARSDALFYKALLSKTEIRAPFTGTVVRKMAEVGESVAPIPPGVNISTASGAIVALADLDTLEVEVDVAEANVAKLGSEQPAEVAVEAFPDRRYKARLRQVIPTADRTKATVQVKVTILDRDKDLKPEMSARVQFLEKEPPKARAGEGAPEPPRIVVTAPSSAIVTRDGKSVVFEVVGDTLRRRVVEVAGTAQGQATIRSGLFGGETLVDSPAETLLDGAKVKVKS